jgi:hypothetical protein
LGFSHERVERSSGGGFGVNEKFMAIVNPAAGGGRAAKLAGPQLARLREKGLRVDVIASTGPGHAAKSSMGSFREKAARSAWRLDSCPWEQAIRS